MNDIYEETIRTSFFTSIVKRYDFEKEIIQPFESISENEANNLWKLMTPLYEQQLQNVEHTKKQVIDQCLSYDK